MSTDTYMGGEETATMRRISFLIPEDTWIRLSRCAARTYLPRAEIARAGLFTELSRMEAVDRSGGRVAEAILATEGDHE